MTTITLDARAELVRQGILELRRMRGRLTKVTTDDVARLLAAIDTLEVIRPAVRCGDCGADVSAIPSSGPGHSCSTPWTAGRAGGPSIDTETRHLREQEAG